MTKQTTEPNEAQTIVNSIFNDYIHDAATDHDANPQVVRDILTAEITGFSIAHNPAEEWTVETHQRHETDDAVVIVNDYAGRYDHIDEHETVDVPDDTDDFNAAKNAADSVHSRYGCDKISHGIHQMVTVVPQETLRGDDQ